MELAGIMVGLADRLTELPVQKSVLPEKVTFGFSKTVTTKETVELFPDPFVEKQETV